MHFKCSGLLSGEFPEPLHSSRKLRAVIGTVSSNSSTNAAHVASGVRAVP